MQGATQNANVPISIPAYRKGEFFTLLTPEAQADLDALIFPAVYAAHQVLFTETQPASGIFIVLDGEVRLSINSQDGRRLSFRIARAGEVLGISSSVSGNTCEMTAETLYPARIARISRQAFLQFLNRHPESYRTVVGEMIRSFNVACEQLRMVGLSTSVPERLARLLLGWSEANGNGASGAARCRLPLTHEEIGEFIGASRETVTRTLSVFKHRRLVSQHGSTIIIPNRNALEAYACG